MDIEIQITFICPFSDKMCLKILTYRIMDLCKERKGIRGSDSLVYYSGLSPNKLLRTSVTNKSKDQRQLKFLGLVNVRPNVC